MPLIAAANGGCRDSNHSMIAAHTLMAAHGFAVVAIGPPELTVTFGTRRNASAQPERLTQVLDWATATEQLRGRLDPSRIAVMGQSCGGIEAMVAGADPRVRSVVALNTGFFESAPGEPPQLGFGREHLERLHTPILFISGGPGDIAYENCRANYDIVRVPAAWADNPQGGHSGFWYGLRGAEPDASITHEAVSAVVQWLDFTLNGSGSARSYFLNRANGLASVGGWSVSSKHFR